MGPTDAVSDLADSEAAAGTVRFTRNAACGSVVGGGEVPVCGAL